MANLDPRLADPRLLALAAMRLKQRQTHAPGIVVVTVGDDETCDQARHRTLGRQPKPWETVLYVTYAPPLPGAQGDEYLKN